MVRTTLDLDTKLLEDVVKATGQKSKTKAVSKALEEYIRRERLQRLLDAPGRITLDENWDIWRRTEQGKFREVDLDEPHGS